jgi:hypothetical protein
MAGRGDHAQRFSHRSLSSIATECRADQQEPSAGGDLPLTYAKETALLAPALFVPIPS